MDSILSKMSRFVVHLAWITPAAAMYASSLMLLVQPHEADSELRFAAGLIFAASAGIVAWSHYRHFSALKFSRFAVMIAIPGTYAIARDLYCNPLGSLALQHGLRQTLVGYLGLASLVAFFVVLARTSPGERYYKPKAPDHEVKQALSAHEVKQVYDRLAARIRAGRAERTKTSELEDELQSWGDDKNPRSKLGYPSEYGPLSKNPTPSIEGRYTYEDRETSLTHRTHIQASLDSLLARHRKSKPRENSSTDVKPMQATMNLRSLVDPRVPAGQIHVSWTCRCGKRLHVQTSRRVEETCLDFVRKAAGPDNSEPIYIQISDSDDDSSLSSTAGGSHTTGRSSLSSSTETTTQGSATDVSKDGHFANGSPFIPAGTKKFMLLCVNDGMRLIRLANVDVTDVTEDEVIFDRLRTHYKELRGRWFRNPFVKPKAMHFVEFRLLYMQRSQECVGKYKTKRIPSIKEIHSGQYVMNPCPSTYEDFIVSPEIFMHEFLNPGDHTGAAASDALPKKLHSKLLWIKNVNSLQNPPVGWGFYIVEGIDWDVVTWCTIVLLLAVTVLTIIWSECTQYVQGATGVGQFCIGALAVLIGLLSFAQTLTTNPQF